VEVDPSGQGWAIVDVETTGLHPIRDRIVEIGIVRLDATGSVQDEWTTVVDPERGQTGRRIHGLAREELLGAPRFREVLDEVLSRLANRVLVAHNAPFDVAFLQSETIRAGIAWAWRVRSKCPRDWA
jgi:DNA polymerase III epsilon subunit-like protein